MHIGAILLHRGERNMAPGDRKNSVTDENIVEGGIYTRSRMSSELSIPKENPRAAILLDSSPRRCIVFKLFTLDVDACQRFLLPVTLPVRGPKRVIHADSGVHGRLDNVIQASPPSSVLFKVAVQEQMIQMPQRRGPVKAYIFRSSSRENVARQSRKKNKHCKAVKNLSTTCLQNGFLSNISSCLICDGSNLIISNALPNCNLTMDNEPLKRNSKKKTKRKGRPCKRLSHCESSSVQSRIASEESICDSSICESSIINDPSSPEEISEDVLSEKATSYSLPMAFSMEDNDSEVCSTDALNPSAATVKCISFTKEVDEFKQTANLCDDFANGFSCKWPGMYESSTSRSNHSSTRQTSQTAISTSSGRTYISNPCDMSSYLPSNQDNALILGAVLDAGINVSTVYSGADAETQLCTDAFSLSCCASGEAVCNSQQDRALPCINSSSYRTNLKKLNDFDISSSSDDPVYVDNIADRTCCSSEACSSSTSNLFAPVKRGKNIRKVSGGFNALQRLGNSNAYGRMRKDINHSVWQRVQKDSGVEVINEFKDLDAVSLQHDTAAPADESRLKDDTSFLVGQSGNRECHRYACMNEVVGDPVSMRMANAVDQIKHLPKSKGKLVNKYSEKLKMDSILVSKQGHYHFLNKGSPNGKNDLSQLSKDNKVYALGMSSIPETSLQKSGTSPEKAHNFQSKLWAKDKDHVNEITPTKNIGIMVHKVDSYAYRNDANLSAKTPDSLDTSCTTEVNHIVAGSKFDEDLSPNFCHVANKKSAGWKVDNGGFHTEHKKQENNFVPGLQKWVPVGKRDEGRSGSKSVSSGSLDCLSTELDGITDKSQYNPHFISRSHVTSDFHCMQEAGDHNTSNSETDLVKIVLVVKEAYRLQIASETVQLATGSPLAEFERLLYSASPVLGQMYSIRSCKSCSQYQGVGNTLCRHQIPNISLQNLWQWYEKPGNYGLEVKVEDYHNPKRLGNDKFNFRAYFVPYLSAVQLFGTAGCTCSDNSISAGKNTKEHVADNMSQSSSQLSRLPIFSLLVPCPQKEAVIQVVDSSSSSSSKEPHSYSVCKACLMSQEVLFEYFESDQPQLRRPLLEKIKELLKGSSFSNSHIFGDPLKLECLNLHDLHPASWFSVAWYPIYRIPDGNFRAAFLTYHSLGHLIHRSALPKSADGVSHIVSPVVGLQSYNAKGECWFQHKGGSENTTTQSGGLPTPAPSEILRERLRTLEGTASAMSRALVPKGDQGSINRQPDYEFFLSRRT